MIAVFLILVLISRAQGPPPYDPAERTVVGDVASVSAGRMIFVLSEDGYPGQHRGTQLTFALTAATKVMINDNAATASALQPRQHGTVRYVDTRGTLTARLIDLTGAAPAVLHQDAVQANTGKPVAAVREVRLQSTAAEGGPSLPQMKSKDGQFMQSQARSGAGFFIAFYVQVDTTQPVRLTYQCSDIDMQGGAVKPIDTCSFEETVPAGFHGIRFHAFPLKYSLARGASYEENVITAEMAPVEGTADHEIRRFQRKLLPLRIVP